jgi:hypothetical protein
MQTLVRLLWPSFVFVTTLFLGVWSSLLWQVVVEGQR